MQFLVYLTVLMVSISTVLLEVHWLTSPPPQPKPAVQQAAAADVTNTSPRKIEGPTAALSPVYPKPDAAPAAPSDESQSQPQQIQTSPNIAAATATVPAAIAANPEPPKPAAETTGVAARAEENKASVAPSAVPVSTATSNNGCDVQACSGAYQSFRASDCTYQPFEGPRRVCEKAPVQRTAREQGGERSERRQWRRDVMQRDGDRTVGRRVYDDPDESNADDDDDSDRITIFRARGPHW
jgi:BA14K-like protein